MKEKDLKVTDVSLEWVSLLILFADVPRAVIITDKVSDFSQFYQGKRVDDTLCQGRLHSHNFALTIH